MDNVYALIMAGGAGTRLWPLSRKTQPKPLIALTEKKRSMFQIAVDRLLPLLPPEQILVVAGEGMTPALRTQAPALPSENFLVEPMARGTAPAVGLGAVHVQARDANGVLAVLTADHYIADEGKFRRVLAAASAAAQAGGIVTLGITPDAPSTGFGYIERGPKARTVEGIDVYELAAFHEKPDAATAEAYIASHAYSWNSGMFIWSAQRVLAEFEQHASDIYTDLMKIAETAGTPRYDQVLNDVWPTIRKDTVDYALMEHIREDVYVIPVEMGWSDIGNFNALYAILSADDDENVIHGEDTILLDTRGALVFGKRLIATIGLEDIVIVETDDALLVCKRDRAQDVRRLVQQLNREKRDNYL